MPMVLIPLIVFIGFFGQGCRMEKDSDLISGTATVTYIELEGGFYGLVADDGHRYDPVNLPAEFRQDGLRVRFRGKEVKDQMSIRMWGTMIELTSIERF